MTADEAILILENTFDGEETIIGRSEDRAVGLGIEALKRFSVARKNNVDIRPTLLLGETED